MAVGEEEEKEEDALASPEPLEPEFKHTSLNTTVEDLERQDTSREISSKLSYFFATELFWAEVPK